MKAAHGQRHVRKQLGVIADGVVGVGLSGDDQALLLMGAVGLALGAGYGYVTPLWVGAGGTVTGLVVLVAGSMRPHRRVPGAAPAAVTASG